MSCHGSLYYDVPGVMLCVCIIWRIGVSCHGSLYCDEEGDMSCVSIL